MAGGDAMNKLPDCMMPDGADPCEGYKTLYREVEDLRWENERVRRRVVQALMEINDRTDGDFPALDNALGAIEALLTGEDPKARNPTWLPAPDTKPPELADAQMVTVRDQNGIPMHDIAAAAEIAWGRWEIYYEYRPLYSDSGPPLCSPKGLEEWAEFVATDSDGSVWQFSSKPIFGNHYRWEAGSGAILQAPSSHRKGRRCCESLMEVMR